MGQGDHSKLSTVKLKIPDPIVSFNPFQPDLGYYKKLQQEVLDVIYGSTQVELPPDYWCHVKFLFTALNAQHAIFTENIVKYTSATEVDAVKSTLSQLGSSVSALELSFRELLRLSSEDDASAESERNRLTSEGLKICEHILHEFADRHGLPFSKAFQTTPFLLAFAGIYKSFSKLFGTKDSSKQRKEMECLEDTLNTYKNACIEERLENIKMLRTGGKSYNVHDYSYEAQIREDVTFGGMVNDYYDKRSPGDISFRVVELGDPTDADKILEEYRSGVKFQYELLFCLEK